MTSCRFFFPVRVAVVLFAALALSACGSSQSDADAHAEAGAHVSSSAGLPGGRIAAGEIIANSKGEATGQSCVDCHGADGNAPIDPSYPKLGGQYADYLAHTLQAYRGGDRDNALMASQARTLSDQQIADVAAWFASRPSQLTDLQGTH